MEYTIKARGIADKIRVTYTRDKAVAELYGATAMVLDERATMRSFSAYFTKAIGRAPVAAEVDEALVVIRDRADRRLGGAL